MTYNPATLHDLGAFWTAQGGVNLGVVGDTSHIAKGTSYHLGKSQLVATAYSIQTARDKAGLTEAASAIDLGKLDGSLANLRTFSKWFVGQCRVNAPGTSDIREFIYSPDGVTVLRWDRQRGYASAPRAGEADTSHFGHSHASWYRDAEKRDHTTAFRPYFAVVAPPVGGGTVDQFITFAKPKVATVPTGTWIYDNEACAAAPGNIQVSPGRTMPVAGKNAAGTVILGYIDTTPTETEVKTYFAKAGSVTIKDVPVGVTDCTAAVAAAVAPLQTQVGVLQTALQQAESARVAALALADEAAAIEKDRIAAAEGARIRAI